MALAECGITEFNLAEHQRQEKTTFETPIDIAKLVV